MAFYKEMYSEKFGVWYPKSVTVGKPIDTDMVAERLAKISTVSRADVLAVLAELPGVLADYMAQGKSVSLDGLGTFRLTLSTRGVADRADFDVDKQIEAVRVQFIPTRKGNAKQGEAQTRALVPTGIEWLKYNGSDEEEVDTGTGEDEEDGNQQLG